MSQFLSDEIKIFAGNANPELANEIARLLGVPLGKSQVGSFSDGETCVKIDELVREMDVFIVQPTCPPHINDNLMELLVMIDAIHRSSARRITAVLPYYGYARQDRKSRSRDPITAKLVANIITEAGADHVLTMDLHCDQIQGFFDIPFDHLRGLPIFAQHYLETIPDRSDVIVVSPDLGSVSRARRLSEKLDVPLAIVDKHRPAPNISEVVGIIGDIKGRRCIMLDDSIDTAGSLTNAAKALMDYGAKEVMACATHAIFSGPALKRIEESPISELVVLNTITLPPEKRLAKIKQFSVAPMFADAIDHIHHGKSISELFK